MPHYPVILVAIALLAGVAIVWLPRRELRAAVPEPSTETIWQCQLPAAEWSAAALVQAVTGG